MKKQQLIWVHICYWLYIFVVLEIMNKLLYQGKVENPSSWISPIAISNYLLFGLVFYCNYFLVLPILFNRKKYVATITSWLALVAVFVLVRYLVQEVWLLKWLGQCNYCGIKKGIYVANNFFQGFSLLILAGTVIWFIDNWLTVKKQQFFLQQEKFIAEKAFIQSQVSTHFLFNTLNNIYSMVFHRSVEALPAIEKLAGIMRYSIKECKEEGVSFETELGYLQNYIDLQMLRVANPAIEYKETGSFEGKMIAPMLLISFVENAFKHGVINDPADPLLIELSMKENTLSLFIKNRIRETLPDQSQGVGQQSVKKRLEIYYAGRYTLDITHDQEHYTSKLILQC